MLTWAQPWTWHTRIHSSVTWCWKYKCWILNIVNRHFLKFWCPLCFTTNVLSSMGDLLASTAAEFYPIIVVHYINIKLFLVTNKTVIFVTTFSNSIQEHTMLAEYGEWVLGIITLKMPASWKISLNHSCFSFMT